MVGRNTKLLLTGAAVLIAAAAYARPGANRMLHTEQTQQQSAKYDTLRSTAIVGHHGGLFGVAADPRTRTFLNQTGIPH